MTWFKVDDNLQDHPKVLRLGRDLVPAMGVWTLAGTWAARYSTDGFVPEDIVRRYDPRQRLARRLVDVGLWERAEADGAAGYHYHDWTDVQPTAAEVEQKRALARERQRKHRQRNGQFGPDSPDPESSARPDSDVTDQHEQGGMPGRSGVTEELCHAPVTRDTTRESPPPRPDPTRISTNYPRRDFTSRAQVEPRTRAHEVLANSVHSHAAHKLVEQHAARCTRRPPARVLADLAVEIDGLLEQDWPPEDITRALAAWGDKGLHPRLLHAVANEVVNARPGRHLRPVPETRPVEDIPDAEIDPDAILGPDGWSPVNDEPLEVSELPYEQRSAWLRARSDEHRADRIRQARTALARRQRNRGTA